MECKQFDATFTNEQFDVDPRKGSSILQVCQVLVSPSKCLLYCIFSSFQVLGRLKRNFESSLICFLCFFSFIFHFFILLRKQEDILIIQLNRKLLTILQSLRSMYYSILLNFFSGSSKFCLTYDISKQCENENKYRYSLVLLVKRTDFGRFMV